MVARSRENARETISLAGSLTYYRHPMERRTLPASEAPEDWGLNGYFYVMPEYDVRGSDRPRDLVWKNRDFLRLKDHAIHLLGPLPGKRILDLGCADGASMVYCGLQGAEVNGVDLDAGQVAKANERLARFGLRGQACAADARAMPFPDEHFDGVISNDFFEHIRVPDKIAVLREVRRVLRPGAPIVIKTPNLAYLRLALWFKRVRAVTRLRDPRRLMIPMTEGHDHPDHIGLTTRWELTRCLIAAGFLNYGFSYAPLRRFGPNAVVELLSTEVPVARDLLCEDVFCRAYKPIIDSHFPA
jgi:2-polyprenyl-3-methyl-5-hydroxy-6-metoxy-1,4-benzoquinol methylase